MELCRVIYLSRVARKVRLADVEAIVEGAAARNTASGLTGLLVYTPSHFLQVLEGDESVIMQTLGRIQRDARHFDVRVLDHRRIVAREFKRWAMVARRLLATSEQEMQQLDASGALALLLREAEQA